VSNANHLKIRKNTGLRSHISALYYCKTSPIKIKYFSHISN